MLFTSYYGVYYFGMIAPHSMYLVATGGFSLFLTVGMLNYNMTMTLSVCDI